MSHNYDRTKTAARPINFDDLPLDKQAILVHVPNRWKVLDVFDGIHGYIIIFKGSPRLDAATLKKLLSFKHFRWVEGDESSDQVSVAF